MSFICLIIGHAYFVRMEFGFGCRCVGCHRCEKFWAMNDRVQALLEWDEDFADLHGYQP